MNTRRLEELAIEAHHRGERFQEFWARHEADVRAAVGHNRVAFARLYHTLLMLTISGDMDGQEPPGDDCPWFHDDEANKPADVGTKARWQGLEYQATDSQCHAQT